jgi:hypothetical protein
LPVVTRIGQIKSYYGYKEWAKAVHQKAGNAYVILTMVFKTRPSIITIPIALKGFSYDSRYYRRTQFDIWPMEEQMQHQRVYHLIDSLKPIVTDSIHTKAGTWYSYWINDVRTYQKMQIGVPYTSLKLLQGEKRAIDLTITNPYPYTVNFSNKAIQNEVLLGACFFKKRWA